MIINFIETNKRKDGYMNKFNNLNKKYKIIMIAIVMAVAIGICYYAYAKEKEGGVEGLEFADTENSENLESGEDSDSNSEKNVSSSENGAANGNMIKVHISGAVNNEGVIELEENSRVVDAIEKAGGLTEKSCTEEINLAYMLEDGMKIHIPTKEEVQNQNLEQGQSGIQTQAQSILQTQLGTQTSTQGLVQSQSQFQTQPQLGAQTSTKSQFKKVNINTATQAELETLPGVGESTAIKIINYRQENGKFKTIQDLKQVSGIGESKYNKMKDLISI